MNDRAVHLKTGRLARKRNASGKDEKKKEPERIKNNKSAPVPFLYAEPVIGYGTHIGKRRINQDALLVLEAETGHFRNSSVVFAAVCDGMGGHSAGEEASRIAVSEMEQWFRSVFPEMLMKEGGAVRNAAESVRELFLQIHGILQESEKRKQGGEMGTTACALLLLDDSYIAAHTGDSRIYAFSEMPALITADHSWVMEEYTAGRLKEEDLRTDPRRNILMKCLGIGNSPEPDIRIGERYEGSLYLLCSDGFWREKGVQAVREEYAAGRLRTRQEAETSIKKGFDLNLSVGETDNMTAVLIRDRAALKGGKEYV